MDGDVRLYDRDNIINVRKRERDGGGVSTNRTTIKENSFNISLPGKERTNECILTYRRQKRNLFVRERRGWEANRENPREPISVILVFRRGGGEKEFSGFFLSAD